MQYRKRKGLKAVCDCLVIHKKVVEKVKSEMPPQELLFDLAEFFRIFGDSTRTGILYALCRAEMCVCDICALIGMTQSAVSHQLKVLRQARLVRCRKDGKIVYYKLDDEHIRSILNLGMQHIEE